MEKVIEQPIIQLMKRYMDQIASQNVDALTNFECHWDGEPGEPGYSEGSYTEHYDS